MRRILLILSLLILIVMGAVPYIMGGIAKSQITQYWAELDKLSGVKVLFTNYQRGWLRSQADIQLSADVDVKGKSTPIEIVFKTQIEHGPLLRNKDSGKFQFGYAQTVLKLQGSGMWAALIIPFIGEQPLFELQSVYGFNHQVKSTLQSAKLDYRNPNMNLEVKWDGIQSTFESNMDFTHIRGTSTISEILGRVSSTGSIPPSDLYRLHSHPVITQFTSQAVPMMPGIMISENHVRWPGLEFTSPVPTQNFSLKEMTSDFNNQLQRDKLSYLWKLHVGGAQFANQIALGPLDLALSVENIDAAAFSQCIGKIRDLVNRGSFDKSMAAMTPQEKAQFEKVTLDVFKHGVVFDLQRFAMRYSNSEFEMRTKVMLPPVNATTQLDSALMNKVQFDVYIKFPMAWQQEFLISALSQKLREQRLKQQSSANVALHMQMQKLQNSALPGNLSAPNNPVGPNAQAGGAANPAAQQPTEQELASLQLANRYLINKSDQEITAMATQQVTELLQKAMQLGLVKQVGNDYIMDYQYHNGELKVNGVVMPLDMFINSMMVLQASAMPPELQTGGAAGAMPAGLPGAPGQGGSGGVMPMPVPMQPGNGNPQSGDFLQQQEELLKQLDEQQKKQTEELNKQLEKLTRRS